MPAGAQWAHELGFGRIVEESQERRVEADPGVEKKGGRPSGEVMVPSAALHFKGGFFILDPFDTKRKAASGIVCSL